MQSFDLNQVSLNDFWKKCHYLELHNIANVIQQKKLEKRIRGIFEGKGVQFLDIVKYLHQTFGGNYRALEFFNALFKQNPAKISASLNTLESFREKYAVETEQVKMDLSKNLLFSQLLKLLEPRQQALLELLSHFRIPVQLYALQLQLSEDFEDFPPILSYLNDLTLVEISLDPELNTIYYYSSAIVKDLLGQAEAKTGLLPFSHQKAGNYHYHIYENIDESLTELEQAFYHFYQAENKTRIQTIGEKLTSFYYNYSLNNHDNLV